MCWQRALAAECLWHPACWGKAAEPELSQIFFQSCREKGSFDIQIFSGEPPQSCFQSFHTAGRLKSREVLFSVGTVTLPVEFLSPACGRVQISAVEFLERFPSLLISPRCVETTGVKLVGRRVEGFSWEYATAACSLLDVLFTLSSCGCHLPNFYNHTLNNWSGFPFPLIPQGDNISESTMRRCMQVHLSLQTQGGNKSGFPKILLCCGNES